MADWVNISDTALDPDAPLTSELAYAWRDNLIAALEGAAGAQRMFQGALERLVAGSELRATVSASASATDMAAIASYSFGIVQGGSLRLGLTRSGSPGGGVSNVYRTRGGVTTLITTTTTNPAGIDIDVLPGDIIMVASSYGGGTWSATANITAFISTAGQDLMPAQGLFGLLVNNRALT